MKIVFMGTPDFALESLKSLYENNKNIIAVVTNPDKPKGRGMKVIETPVKEYAKRQNIKIYQPLKVKNNDSFLNEICCLEPDLLCVVAYGKILPKEILDIPKYGAINVHGSLLPKYRGAAPIQWAVLNGEKETGNTTMFMDEGMDTGDIIYQSNVKIDDNETTGELWQTLSVDGGKLLLKTINEIEKIIKTKEIQEIEKKYNQILEDSDSIFSVENANENEHKTNKNYRLQNETETKRNYELQNETETNRNYELQNEIKTKRNYELQNEIKKQIKAKKQGDNYTIAPMLDKKMAHINWNENAKKIHNLIRGLNPIMGAYSFYNGKKIKIWKDEIVSNEKIADILSRENISNIEPGTIIYVDKKSLIVKTYDSAISILELQAENSKRMDIKDFLNGNKFQINDKLN